MKNWMNEWGSKWKSQRGGDWFGWIYKYYKCIWVDIRRNKIMESIKRKEGRKEMVNERKEEK